MAGFINKVTDALAMKIAGAAALKSRVVGLDDTFRVVQMLNNQFNAEFMHERSMKVGYRKNSAVFACVSAIAFEYAKGKFYVTDGDGERAPDHPVQAFLDKPNEEMSWAEFAIYIATYTAIGAQTYLLKLRNAHGKTLGFMPYSSVDIKPEKTKDPVQIAAGLWVGGYWFKKGTEEQRWLDRDEVIHIKWPSVDPERPWLALPPLMTIGDEWGTDVEAGRYMMALLRNDAVVRTVITQSPEFGTVGGDRESMVRDFEEKYGREGRGGVMALPPGAKVERLGLNLQELAFDALRDVPETRISAAFRTPAIVAGLNVGLKRSTFSNFGEARLQFVENTISLLWTMTADAIWQSMTSEYGTEWDIRVDTSQVPALKENQDALVLRVTSMYDRGIITLNEARAMLGLPEIEEEPEKEEEPPASTPKKPAAGNEDPVKQDDDSGDDDDEDPPPKEESAKGRSIPFPESTPDHAAR